MPMILAIGRLSVHIPESHSLKEKRRVVKSLTERVRARFNVSIAEVDDQQLWQVATIGVVVLSSSGQHCDELLQRVIAFVEQNLQAGYLGDVSTEIMHLD